MQQENGGDAEKGKAGLAKVPVKDTPVLRPHTLVLRLVYEASYTSSLSCLVAHVVDVEDTVRV